MSTFIRYKSRTRQNTSTKSRYKK